MLSTISLVNPWLSISLEQKFGKKLQNTEKETFSLLILYGSETGGTKIFSESIAAYLNTWQTLLEVELKIDVSAIHEFNHLNNNTILLNHSTAAFSSIARFEDLLNYDFVITCISTWTDGKPPQNSKDLVDFLEDLVSDFRVPRNHYSKLGIAVVGFGNREYERFCTPAISITSKLKRLGADFLIPLLKVNEAEETDELLMEWKTALTTSLLQKFHNRLKSTSGPQETSSNCCGNNNSCVAKKTNNSTDIIDDEDSDSTMSVSSDDGGTEDNRPSGCGDGSDVEDLIFGNDETVENKAKQQMLTNRQRQQLVKEGYKIVGSHSAVKLCRWTKSQLRGRGGCYKHTFYGIQSHLCMEATPSLACANKCVFCWRHHKNPVGTSWKWEMDTSDDIMKGFTENHYKMIKELKGVGGVKDERYLDASTKIRHCALSLVGEPIMYPEINNLLQEMHHQQISTFLVTNSQFPDQMRQLCPVTQLYLSIDAANKDTLKAVDRPLFSDYWERFNESIKIIRDIKTRTVFRLTLIKKYNMTESLEFSKLIEMGLPDLIEIKAVTYCGKGSDDITMKDIPWHDEIIAYANSIINASSLLLENYSIACEHKHSCCVLIAHNKFKLNGVWNTWIDYSRFFELSKSGKSFTSLDYCAPTPQWCLYNSVEKGFDPKDQRMFVKGRHAREAKERSLI